MEDVFRSLKRGIVLEGLEVLFYGGNITSWAGGYSHKEELLVPGELEFVEKFAEYISLQGSFRNVPNPRVDLSFVEKVCSDLG